MARKISGNPRIAYEQGKREGYIAGGAEAIEYARHFAVLAIYNIVQNFVKSEKSRMKWCWLSAKSRTESTEKNFSETTTMC